MGNETFFPRRHHAIVLCAALMSTAACTTRSQDVSLPIPKADVEDVYILRSIREHRDPTADWCAATRTGFEPFPTDPERFFSFWSVQTQPQDGSVVDAKARNVAELRACFGPTDDRARHSFYAELELGGRSLRGRGECRAVGLDVPETGLISVHCHLVLGDGPGHHVEGVLTTNTLTSELPFGGETQPPGYVQASIATIRVWKART